jgi:hypothetical protein
MNPITNLMVLLSIQTRLVHRNFKGGLQHCRRALFKAKAHGLSVLNIVSYAKKVSEGVRHLLLDPSLILDLLGG